MANINIIIFSIFFFLLGPFLSEDDNLGPSSLAWCPDLRKEYDCTRERESSGNSAFLSTCDQVNPPIDMNWKFRQMFLKPYHPLLWGWCPPPFWQKSRWSRRETIIIKYWLLHYAFKALGQRTHFVKTKIFVIDEYFFTMLHICYFPTTISSEPWK